MPPQLDTQPIRSTGPHVPILPKLCRHRAHGGSWTVPDRPKGARLLRQPHHTTPILQEMDTRSHGTSPSSCTPWALVPRELEYLEKESRNSGTAPLAVMLGFILNSFCNSLMAKKGRGKEKKKRKPGITRTFKSMRRVTDPA